MIKVNVISLKTKTKIKSLEGENLTITKQDNVLIIVVDKQIHYAYCEFDKLEIIYANR